ncbi:hypothetical protein PF005_g28969, partial [Phytophthora fragariae]
MHRELQDKATQVVALAGQVQRLCSAPSNSTGGKQFEPLQPSHDASTKSATCLS